MYDINFFSYAWDKNNSFKYQSFIIQYILFALSTNKNSHVEIIIPNVNEFEEKYKNELVLLKNFNSNFLIRKSKYEVNKNTLNTYRFFEIPVIKSKF